MRNEFPEKDQHSQGQKDGFEVARADIALLHMDCTCFTNWVGALSTDFE